MNGVKYLLDTNVILGLYKRNSDARDLVVLHGATTTEGAYSAITRMELLGYPGITGVEEKSIIALLDKITYIPVTSGIEDKAIRVRRKTRLKLPDAIIVATAQAHNLQLLTLDKELQKLF